MSKIGPATLDAKQIRERSARNPPAAFDVTVDRNVMMAAGLRASAKAQEQPPEPDVGALVPDPTDKRVVETEQRHGYSGTARRKGQQQTTQTYGHRVTSRLYRLQKHPEPEASDTATLRGLLEAFEQNGHIFLGDPPPGSLQGRSQSATAMTLSCANLSSTLVS